MVSSTAIAEEIASPLRKLTPSTNMPSRASITVVPANSTARPAVYIAPMVEARTPVPLRWFSRKRVTMNSA